MAELNSSPEKNGGKTPRKRLTARVDLTAMVDLAFLLITFFMLTTSLQKQRMFGVVMPDNSAPDSLNVPASRTLTICLGNDNKVVTWLGLAQSPISKPRVSDFGKDGLRQAITEASQQVLAKTGKSLLLIIKPSDHSVYANLVNTLDEVKITGQPEYAITDISANDIAVLKQQNAY